MRKAVCSLVSDRMRAPTDQLSRAPAAEMIKFEYKGHFIMTEKRRSLKGRRRLVVSLLIGHKSGHRNLTQNSQVMLICKEFCQSCGPRSFHCPCGTRDRVPGWAPKQLNGSGGVSGGGRGKRKGGSNQGRE